MSYRDLQNLLKLLKNSGIDDLFIKDLENIFKN